MAGPDLVVDVSAAPVLEPAQQVPARSAHKAGDDENDDAPYWRGVLHRDQEATGLVAEREGRDPLQQTHHGNAEKPCRYAGGEHHQPEADRERRVSVANRIGLLRCAAGRRHPAFDAVSYTHLTL